MPINVKKKVYSQILNNFFIKIINKIQNNEKECDESLFFDLAFWKFEGEKIEGKKN